MSVVAQESDNSNVNLSVMKMTLSPAIDSVSTPDDLVLWRYMDFPKFLDLISTGTLKMPRASSMEDGHEGIIGSAAITATLAKWKAQGAPAYWRSASINKQIKEMAFWQDRTYVSCWNTFPQENAGLWRIYGDDKGVVIRTSWKSLRDSFAGSADCVDRVFYGQVEYRNYVTDAKFSDNFTDEYFVKRNEFVHENEFRLVAHDNSREHDYNKPETKDLPFVATLPCDPNIMIEEVIVSPLLGEWVTNVVSDVSRIYAGKWHVRRSDIYQPPLRSTNEY